MRQRENKIKRGSRQLVWLLLALFCIVFSSAVKKVIQLHADQKISLLTHREGEGSRLLTQNIKDGSREKHEIQALVSHVKLQSPLPGFVPSFLSLVQRSRQMQLKSATQFSSSMQYINREAGVCIQIPEYLFIHRLQV